MSFMLLALLAVPAAAEPLTLRGRAICLDAELQPAECTPESRYGLRTASGELHPFDAADTRTPIFADERVRARELEVHVWKRDSRLEIIKVYTVVDGELHLPHYFCEVCTITAFTGGPCWCCQQEFEFRETRVAGG